MFIFLLVILVALAMIIHELGHIVMARRFKVTASELGLGLGPVLMSWRLCGLRITLRAYPAGSFVRLDGTALEERSARQQLLVHLGGIIFNLIMAAATYGTVFCWINLLLAGGNLLPLYQHDGWKCGVVLVRAFLRRKSVPIERAFTYSGGFLSLVIAFVIIKSFVS
jgi:membrane-associated protease RseP (regulator of RpoE activity)